jgi:hypothetical protein
MAVYESLLLNTAVPQIQAAQAGDSYVMVVNATTPALRITQTGTGDAILVEDSANPDATPFVVTAAGDVGAGVSAPGSRIHGAVAANGTPVLTVQNTSTSQSAYGILFDTELNNAGSRNWALISEYAAAGDFHIVRSNAKDGNPFSAGTSVLALDSSGNLGLGVTPSAWNANFKAYETTGGSLSAYLTSEIYVSQNAYNDGSWKYKADGFAEQYIQVSGQHRWLNAPSGTAGNAISFTQAMTLDASGRLLVGATSASSGARATLTSAAQASGAACADSGILLYPTANLATGEYAPFITWSGNFTNPNRARAAIGAVSSSTSTALDLVFLTRSAADASEIGTGSERARITSGGNLLVGKQSSDATIAGCEFSATGAVLTRSSGDALLVNRETDDGTAVTLRRSNTTVGTISVTTTSTAYNTSSDYRLKDNPQPLTNSGAFIDALKPKTWDWKADGSKGVGFIAHEAQEVSPSSVVGAKDAVDADGKPVMQAMEYGSAEFIANIVAELQSLRARVAQLEAK